ncbi:MAG: PIG-L family deacetylase [Planctomycetes bacterium]|nr:PIG-L family deacetylase [Planctomycetota bacterium]
MAPAGKAPWSPPPKDGKLRIICFGAHPDDAEFRAGGVAAMWAAMGHHVKFVSTTNGDAGHWDLGGAVLARKRYAEVRTAAQALGIEESEVLEIHDGELMPTLENRQQIIRLIREWQADVVMAHRPYDYHSDHRYTGVLVQDAAFNVTIPTYSPNTPRLERNPVFLFYYDKFQRPYPFQPDIVVGIDEVFEKKVDALMALESQLFETVYADDATREKQLAEMPKDPAGRRAVAYKRFAERDGRIADQYREALGKWYGPDNARAIKYAEAFEVCEYGSQPTADEIKQLFPFLPK